MGVHRIIKGQTPETIKSILVVSNHISWIDIPLMLSIAPVRFLSKSEIKKWPILGYLATRAGTIFIDRSKVSEIKKVTKEITQLIGKDKNILLFPEGTTSKGDSVLPFHASFLQTAINSRCQVLPVAIRYLTSNKTPDYMPAYVDGLSFFDILIRVARSKKIVAEVQFYELINTRDLTRRALAKILHQKIQSSF